MAAANGTSGDPCINCGEPLNDVGLCRFCDDKRMACPDCSSYHSTSELARAGGRCPNDKDGRADAAASAAEYAFWEIVAELFPEITSGDFPPGASAAFSKACRDAVGEWLLHNDFQRK